MNTWIYAWEILINILESSFLLVFMEDKMEHTKRIPNGYASILKIAFVMADAFIDFYIKPVENMLLISIENSFDGICKKDSQDNYISIKHSKSNGIGLKRVNEIVEQNDGIIDITNTDTIFCVHIMFPLKEKDIYENCNT